MQNLNLAAVNEAVNDIYYEAEDYESLRQSVDDFDNFDQPALAQRCPRFRDDRRGGCGLQRIPDKVQLEDYTRDVLFPNKPLVLPATCPLLGGRTR